MFLVALLVALLTLPPVGAVQYCIDAVQGNDLSTGLLVSGNRSSCWASSNGAYAYLNSGSINPGDEILYCRGNREYQGGMLIGPTGSSSSLGTRAKPIVFGAYDCRNN